jgi:DNA-binding GntR family transcriptional regulator
MTAIAAKTRAAPAAATLPPGQEVAAWLREQIRRGRFVPGQRLVEADIMRDTGASRGHVREGIQRLEAEGLLVLAEFRGASVRSFSENDVRNLYRARMALEGMAAHDFAASGGRREKAALTALQKQLNVCVKNGDHDGFARLNDQWHDAIIQGAGNSYIASFVQRLNVPVQRMLFSTFYKAQRIEKANGDHRLITDAIVKGRAAEAGALMQAHIEAGLGALLDISRESQNA